MWLGIKPTGKAVAKTLWWMFLLGLYHYLVSAVATLVIGGFDLGSLLRIGSITLGGLPYTFLDIEWIVAVIAVYKMITAWFEGPAVSTIDFLLIGFIFWLIGWGMIAVQLSYSGFTVTITLGLAILFYILLAGYGFSLFVDINAAINEQNDRDCFEAGVLIHGGELTQKDAVKMAYIGAGVLEYCKIHEEQCDRKFVEAWGSKLPPQPVIPIQPMIPPSAIHTDDKPTSI